MLLQRFHRGLLVTSTAAAAVFAIAVGATLAHASEHVTLRNGFSYDCAHRQPLADGRVRLFLDSGDNNNYIDLPAAEIVSVATVAEPSAVTANSTSSVASQTSASRGTTSSTVTPAKVRSLLAQAGAEHDIDVELLASIVHAESDGRARVLSRTGAQGLMQLMPGTAREMGVHDSFRPAENINGGTAYLDALLTRYHNNLALALAAYNAGPAAVDRYHGIPPYRETRAYVARVMTEFKHRRLQLAHRQAEPTTSPMATQVAGNATPAH